MLRQFYLGSGDGRILIRSYGIASRPQIRLALVQANNKLPRKCQKRSWHLRRPSAKPIRIIRPFALSTGICAKPISFSTDNLDRSAGKCRSESIQKNKIDPKLTGLYHNSDSTLPRTYHHQQPILPLIHSSNPTMSSPDNTPTNTRRIRRTRVPSSLEGMLSPEEDTSIPKLSPTNSDYSHTERQELQEMALKLRRTKRRLLLKSAEQPSNNVDRLREMLLQLSVGSSGDDFHNAPYSMRARSSSLGSSTNSME
jgi:hypothetical protein